MATSPTPLDPPADAAGSEAETRSRLLDAAEQLFASNGFRATAVRQITTNAGANIAAVNYHFGGKDNLYVEVMVRRLRELRDAQVATIAAVMTALRPTPTLDQLVRSFIEASLAPLSPEQDNSLLQLFYLELADRRLPEQVWRAETEAVETALMGALRELEPGLSEVDAHHCIHSIQDQLSGLVQRTAFEAESENTGRAPLPLPEALDHLVRFTVAGIRGCGR